MWVGREYIKDTVLNKKKADHIYFLLENECKEVYIQVETQKSFHVGVSQFKCWAGGTFSKNETAQFCVLSFFLAPNSFLKMKLKYIIWLGMLIYNQS